MKTSKYLTICLLVCCMFVGHAMAQLNAGIGISIRAEFQGTNDLAFVAQEGDIIEYIVTVEVSADQFPITDGEPTLTLPDGTVIDLDDNLALGTGESMEYPPQAYTVDSADLGNQPGAAVNEVRALAAVEAISQTGVTEQDVTATTNFDTVVISPDFMVMKNCVNPNGTLIGEDAEFLITIMNTGDVPLDFIVNDASAVPPLVGVAVGPIDAGQTYETTISIPTTGECENALLVLNSVEVEGYYEGELIGTDEASAECPVICPPNFTVNKYCLTEPITDEPYALFEIVIENTGYVPLEFEIDDEAAGIQDLMVGPIEPGAIYVTEVEVPADCIGGYVSNRVVVQAYYDGEPVLEPLPAEAECPCAGLEGCTPGFWKNNAVNWEASAWCEAYSPEDSFESVFGVDVTLRGKGKDTIDDPTLLEALNANGGGINALARHATAALLNVCNGCVSYPMSGADIINAVQQAVADGEEAIQALHSQLAEYNEAGCPVNQHGECVGVEDGVVY